MPMRLQPLVRAGVPGFKCFLIHSGIDGFAWVDEADLRLALGKLRGTGLPLLVHAEVAGPVDAATSAAERERRRLAQVLDLSCVAARCGGSRRDRAADPAGRGVRHTDSHRASVERGGVAIAC